MAERREVVAFSITSVERQSVEPMGYGETEVLAARINELEIQILSLSTFIEAQTEQVNALIEFISSEPNAVKKGFRGKSMYWRGLRAVTSGNPITMMKAGSNIGLRTGLGALGLTGPEAMLAAMILRTLIPIVEDIIKRENEAEFKRRRLEEEYRKRADTLREVYRSLSPE